MDERASVADLRQGFLFNLVMVDGKIAYIHKIDVNANFTAELLESGKIDVIKWSPKRILPPTGRLGYVNTGLGCAYVSRRPVRRWAIGLNLENLRISSTMDTENTRQIVDDLRRMRSDAFHYAVIGQYPSLVEAWEAAQYLESSFAFDKQFEVDYRGTIRYRGQGRVGVLDTEAMKIRFDNPVYQSLLDGSYGKSFR